MVLSCIIPCPRMNFCPTSFPSQRAHTSTKNLRRANSPEGHFARSGLLRSAPQYIYCWDPLVVGLFSHIRAGLHIASILLSTHRVPLSIQIAG